jgi:hypothetical protein
LVRFNGTLFDGRGWPVTVPVSVTFAIYDAPSGWDKPPVWQEVQQIAPNSKGSYSTLLGLASTRGIPAEVFDPNTSQWLGVKVEGEPEQARVLLVSVPYALKAGDAQTLGGLPASAFALAGTQAVVAAPASIGPSASPDAGSNVTTTGGTANYLPKFNGASTVVDSQIFDTGTAVGIGDTPNPSVKLDVNGAMIMRGNMQVTRSGTASSAKGYPSYGFDFYSSVYNSSTRANDNPFFQLQSEPAGNNSSSPSATFNLLFSNAGSTPAETGFYINPNGILHFASGQTFPGGSGTITGVTAGTALTGGGTSGSVTLNVDTTKVPLLSSANTFSANQAITGNLTVSGTTTFNGILTAPSGITTGANISARSITAAGANNAILGKSFTTASSQFLSKYSSSMRVGVWGDSGVDQGGAYAGVVGSTDDAAGVLGIANDGVAVQGNVINEGTAVLANAATGYGVAANATSGIGVAGSSGTGIGGSFSTDTASSPATRSINYSTGLALSAFTEGAGTGLLATSQSASNISQTFFGGFTAGLWGDSGSTAGLIVSSDNDYAAEMANDSASLPTLYLDNEGGGGTTYVAAPHAQIASVLRAEGRGGVCGMNGAGDISCTGQMKSLNAVDGGGRQVETYAVESSENWFEDFGSSKLVNGAATVTIDSTFAGTVNTDVSYHVYLTPNGDSKGLYVTNKGAGSFEVHESGGGSSSIAFDYRIVAKRRGHEAERLVDVTERFEAEKVAAAAHRKPRSAAPSQGTEMQRRGLGPLKPVRGGVRTHG